MKAPKQETIIKITYVLMAVTAVGITVTGILTKIPVIKIIPLYVSIFILMLQSRVSRVAYLLGGINSVLYALVDFSYGLYASAAYDVLFSMTIQIFTFFHWKKRAYGQAVQLKKMSTPWRVISAVGFAAVFAGLSVVLSAVGSSYRFFDTLQPLLGIAVSFLTAFAFVEYGPLQLLSITGTITLNVVMLAEHPERLPYLIYAIYSFICVVFALIRLYALWKEQKAQREASPAKAN